MTLENIKSYISLWLPYGGGEDNIHTTFIYSYNLLPCSISHVPLVLFGLIDSQPSTTPSCCDVMSSTPATHPDDCTVLHK